MSFAWKLFDKSNVNRRGGVVVPGFRMIPEILPCNCGDLSNRHARVIAHTKFIRDNLRILKRRVGCLNGVDCSGNVHQTISVITLINWFGYVTKLSQLVECGSICANPEENQRQHQRHCQYHFPHNYPQIEFTGSLPARNGAAKRRTRCQSHHKLVEDT